MNNDPNSLGGRGGRGTGRAGQRWSLTDRPDLQSQLEDLRLHVWTCEIEWRLDDRIDLALKAERHT